MEFSQIIVSGPEIKVNLELWFFNTRIHFYSYSENVVLQR